MNDHLEPSRLVDLLNRRLSPALTGETYGHLAFCDACAGILRAISDVRDDFDGAWDTFVATCAGAAAHRDPEPEATHAAHASAHPVVLHRVSTVVRVFIDRARAMATIAAEAMTELSPGPG